MTSRTEIASPNPARSATAWLSAARLGTRVGGAAAESADGAAAGVLADVPAELAAGAGAAGSKTESSAA